MRTGIGSVCGSSSAGALPAGRAPAVAGRIQSMPASCHAAADCCQTETGGASTGGAGGRDPNSPGGCWPGECWPGAGWPGAGEPAPAMAGPACDGVSRRPGRVIPRLRRHSVRWPGRVVARLGRGGLPEFVVVERQAGFVVVQVTSHIGDPARITAHGRRKGHTARHTSRRNEQRGASPARPAVRAHGRPAGWLGCELRTRAVKGESVTPVMLAVEWATAEAIRQGAQVS